MGPPEGRGVLREDLRLSLPERPCCREVMLREDLRLSLPERPGCREVMLREDLRLSPLERPCCRASGSHYPSRVRSNWRFDSLVVVSERKVVSSCYVREWVWVLCRKELARSYASSCSCETLSDSDTLGLEGFCGLCIAHCLLSLAESNEAESARASKVASQAGDRMKL